jgi:hypothetical protein
LYANEWSDGCEPHYSVKANRGSAWLKTVTISPQQGNKHGLSYTYPVAFGKSSCSHEEVEEQFAEDLKKLSNRKMWLTLLPWRPSEKCCCTLRTICLPPGST